MKRGVIIALGICAWAGSADAAITMNPNPLDAGSALLNAPTMANGTLSSDSSGKVDLSAPMSCTGGGGTFSFDRTTSINLNNPQSITLSYTPTVRGTRTCTVRVYDENTTTQIGSFTIRGTGLAPATIVISGSTDFGSLRWNDLAPTHSSTRTITVSNSGDVGFDVTSVTLGNTTDFSIISGGGSATIGPLSSRPWVIGFDPVAGGNKSSTLTFAHTASNTVGALSLTGVATNAVIGTPLDPDYGIVPNSSSAQADVQVNNNGVATRGPLTITQSVIAGGSWFTFAGCGGGRTCNVAFQVNNSVFVGVLCTPPFDAPVGTMQTATVTFTSDSDPGADSVSTLTCTSGKSDIALSMNTLTFPPQLVNTTSAPLTVTVVNNGNLNAQYYLQRVGGNSSAFTVTPATSCGGSSTNQCTLTPGGMNSFTVTFTPTTEGDISAGVQIMTTGASPQVPASGRGVDKHIGITDAMQFPDTYRNPGTKAALVPVVVMNTGEYPLHVSKLEVNGPSDVWALAEPFVPFDVPGLDSKSVMVKFSPLDLGKAPDAGLLVETNDTLRPVSTVALSGNGKERQIAMLPGALDFGNTGAGIPVQLSAITKSTDELLAISNTDVETFEITGFRFKETGATADSKLFYVQQLDGDDFSPIMLMAGTDTKFDVVFTPTKVGEFSGELSLLLDGSDVNQRTIAVQGNALFVDAGGGGGFGCSTGAGAGGGVLLALLALRRRRSRA